MPPRRLPICGGSIGLGGSLASGASVVQWQVLLTAARATPDAPSLFGSMGPSVSSPSSDVGIVSPQSWFVDLTLVSMDQPS